jgi:hypothetical protein
MLKHVGVFFCFIALPLQLRFTAISHSWLVFYTCIIVAHAILPVFVL